LPLNFYIELIASLFSIAGVLLTTKQNIWCWFVSLVGVTLSLYIFFSSRLFIQSMLQVFYIVMIFYGWYNWKHGGKDETVLKVSSAVIIKLLPYLITGIFFSVITGYIFNRYTSDPLPWLDSATSVFGIIATYLMAKKIIQHWYFWIVIDIFLVCICFYQKLYGFSMLYFIFILTAIYGLTEWRKELVKSDSAIKINNPSC
jgi:nicotinamide mononucleotide transporter